MLRVNRKALGEHLVQGGTSTLLPSSLIWGQRREDATRDDLEVTFKIIILGDTGAGGLRAEGGQMVLSHPSGQGQHFRVSRGTTAPGVTAFQKT